MRSKVMLIDACSQRMALLKSGLESSSFDVVIELAEVRNLIERVKHTNPDAIVIGMECPDAQCIDELEALNLSLPQPVVIFSEKDSPQAIKQTTKAGVSAYVVDNMEPHRVPSIVRIAIERFKETQKVLVELKQTKTKLAERKVLEKAKGLLMAEKGISEDEAYAFLRKMAMNKGLKIGAVAENIVDVMGLLQQQAQA